MAKKITAESAAVRAEHLRKQGIQNEKLAHKWDRIAKRLANKEKE